MICVYRKIRSARNANQVAIFLGLTFEPRRRQTSFAPNSRVVLIEMMRSRELGQESATAQRYRSKFLRVAFSLFHLVTFERRLWTSQPGKT
jgi:hypothetical protein